MSRDLGYDLLKVLVKSMVTTLKNDLVDFMQARRACQKHVFLSAEIRHEPTRLINRSIWGVNLFPTPLVREAIDNASKSNLSLRRRWGMQEKRKFSEGSGPQPKNKRQKKGSFCAPQSQQPLFQMTLPVSSASPQGQGSRQQQFMIVPSSQSPAFNPAYESQNVSFRVAGFIPHRGGRGRAGRGRGHHQQQQARGQGGPRHGASGRGGSSRGRGARGDQSQ